MDAASRGERWSFRAMTQKPRLAGRSVFRAHVRAFPEIGAGFKDGGLSKVPAFPLGKWPDGLFRRTPKFHIFDGLYAERKPLAGVEIRIKRKARNSRSNFKILACFSCFL